MSNVHFGDVRSASMPGVSRTIGSSMGYTKNEPYEYNDLRQQSSQTPQEYSNAKKDSRNTDSSLGPKGDYERMTGKEANELFFNGIDSRTKRPTFCDKLGQCFMLGVAAVASAKAMGVLGGKAKKTKRRKNKNRKTKRKR